MRKLFRTSYAVMAMVAALLSMTMISCGPEEPFVPSTVAVTGVTLSKTSLSLTEGGSETLTATVVPDNATNKNVSWSSSNTATATVDNTGKVTAVKAGSATITVTTADGGKTAICSVTVTSKVVTVTGVALDKETLEIAIGKTAQLKAMVAPDDATNKEVEWSTSDDKIVTVDAEGKITAIALGEATITVKTKDGGMTATCKVTVKQIEVESLTVEPTKAEVIEGKTIQLKVTVSPADADQDVDWKTLDERIATVDENGLVTAVSPGTVRIAVRSRTYNEKQAFCEVTVKQDPTLKGISLDATEIKLQVGESRTLTVFYTPEYATDKEVSWSSSDPATATVTDGNVVGLKEGSATITATSQVGGFKAECLVVVSKTVGPFLYYTMNLKMYVNGANDPLDRAFNEGNSFWYYRSWYVAADKGDRISLEEYGSYSSDYTRTDQFWICKNRKPIVNLYPIYVNDNWNTGSHYPQDFAARNGVYAVLSKYSNNSDWTWYVVRATEDGIVSKFDITGSYRLFSSPSIAVAPNGDIHVAAHIRDAFGKYYVAWYTIKADGSVIEKLIDEDTYPLIAVSEAGDVFIYALTHPADSEGQHLTLYKNGVAFKTIDTVSEGFYPGMNIFCLGNDVYTATTVENKPEIRVHKNGTLVKTVDTGQPGVYLVSKNQSLRVTSNGNIFLGWTGSDSITRLTRNGEVLYSITGDDYSSYCVIE